MHIDEVLHLIQFATAYKFCREQVKAKDIENMAL
jgi:hypothetical protein